ncbi:NADP-dependent phosphogluconate dehydrogenase [Candidatus Tachikawaea gelatinosa]|uniref:6-phosphogluconate dehydrogenase, decarboxylating n=1 Tax=Candidatus Tachikawaea gelatinosa TaxID=1410383 RepID=A0A090ALV9_9ENTR|nr:NADP-dependent phosphogluconate dehydrogenase [Candidatus Tachikawaea gelatinosa]BAP58644.1 6-phosphogluconate dehydrogenase decarboxylating [Candidatus Tachikawaea gelatinosa]
MFKQQIGVVGMAVMGRNLAINIERNGYTVSIFNRSKEKTIDIIKKNYGKKLFPFYSLKEFVESLNKPRIILIMVKAGKATDSTIKELTCYLNKGDILIDCGNTFYKHTIIRNEELSKKEFHFIGTGISGGEEGALKGPSIMPGGEKLAYKLVEPIFKKIAAYKGSEPCVTYIGPNGSGHYVKMVHNGIEYADMQLIAEAYFLLKNFLRLNNQEISLVFDEWNNGELNSYLIEITKNIVVKKDECGHYLIDLIIDSADNKGTGKWTCQDSLDFGEPISIIAESLFTRYLSSMKNQRMIAAKNLHGPCINKFYGNKTKYIEKIRKSLYFSKIIAYAQGFSQMRTASKYYKWNINCANIAKIFRAGCIIRAQFLEKIIEAYENCKDIKNLLLTPYFRDISSKYQKDARDVISNAIKNGIPVPTFSSAITYYDSYRASFLPANLIQAQRDYFGSHTYRRIDKEGIFHTNWKN